MKRSDFISSVLDSSNNTVFTTAEQVENAIEMFESLGMLPPKDGKKNIFHNQHEWEEE